MAMRPQPGGLTDTFPRILTRTISEDFQPKFERKEEAAAYIISVHLPGFVEERIKITYLDSTRTIRAQGERPLENNRWSEFNQTYSVPENCDAAKIESKFEQGILTITMPKKIVEQVVTVPEEAKTTQKVPTTLALPPSPPAPLEKIPPKRPTSTYGVERAAADTILIHLPPGFVKERIKITYMKPAIKVQGERTLENNKWSPYTKTFLVPENYDTDKIQSKFEQGILTVTMPKKIVEEVVTAPEEAKSTQEVPRTDLPLPPPPPATLEEIPPERPTSTYGVENLREEKLPQSQINPKAVTTDKKVMQKATEDIPPKASTSTAPENERRRVVEVGQSQRPSEATAEEAQKGLHAALPKDNSTEDVEKPICKTSMKSASEIVDQRSIDKKDTVIEARGKAKETKESDNAMEQSIVKVKESAKKRAESARSESSAPKISKDRKEKRVISVANQRKRKEGINTEKGVGVKIALDSAKQKVKNLTRRLNEDERQMLVNLGAAVLVLVALGAYVYFSHRSSGRAED